MARSDHTDDQWEFAVKISGLTFAIFEKASWIQFSMLTIRLAMAATGCITPFITKISVFRTNDAPDIVGLFTLLLGFVWLILYLWYYDLRTIAEWGRRMSLVMGGLGPTRDAIDDLNRRLDTLSISFETSDHDRSGVISEFGSQRLAEMIDERAKASGQMYRSCEKHARWFLSAFVVMTIIVFYFLVVSLSGSDEVRNILGAYFAIIVLFILPDAAVMWGMYRQAAKTVTEIFQQRLPRLKGVNYNPVDVQLLLEDYTSAVENAPMFFPWVIWAYRKRQQRLAIATAVKLAP